MAKAGSAYQVTVDCSLGDYDIPSSVQIQELRIKNEGQVTMQTWGGESVVFDCTDQDVFMLGQPDWRRVRKVGTTEALRTGNIILRGYYVKDS